MVKKDTPFFEGKILGSYYGGFSNIKEQREKSEKIIASNQIDFLSSTWYSPELTPDMWQMPKSRQEVLRWVRLFFALDPYIYPITMMHALYPFSNFEIVAEDEAVTKFYRQVAFNKNFNLLDFILKMSISYEKFGEAIVNGIKNEVKVDNVKFIKWDGFILFEPEQIEIRQAFFERVPRYYLQITPEMKKEIKEAKRYKREIDSDIESLLNKNEYLLDNDTVSSIMNLTDASATRGTSPLQCLLRILLFQDKISMLKLTAIDRFRYPIEMWKIGDMSLNPPKIPNKQELEDFKEFIKQAKNNPPFSIFVPPFVNYEILGYSGQNTFDYKDDYEWIRDSILVAMGVSKDIILGEVKGWTNTKQLTLQKLIAMYKTKQDKFTNWMIYHFFEPLARWNGFYNKAKELDLPKISYEKKLSLDKDESEDFKELWEAGLISTKTYLSKYKSLDMNQEEVLLKKERGTIFDDGQRIRNKGEIKPFEETIPKITPEEFKESEIPEIPKESEIPEMPKEPEIPETPKEPEIPETPEI